MKNFHSIRWRLQLWYGLLLAVILGVFSITVVALERARELKRIDTELQQLAVVVNDATRPRVHAPRAAEDTGYPGGLNFRQGEADPFMHPDGPYYALWKGDGKRPVGSDYAPADIPRPKNGEKNLRQRGEFSEAIVWSHGGDVLLVGQSVTPELTALRLFAWKLAGASILVLVLGLLIGGWVVKRALHPIADISATASKISSGDLSQRINVAGTDNELEQLASVLNSTFARLDAAFAQQARFTADAAHELRTPVTVILTHTQSAIETPCESPEHNEAFAACQRAAQRMRRLIESLLELARFDAGETILHRQTFDLSRVVMECLELVQPLAEKKSIKVTFSPASIHCTGDPDRLGQVLLNLLTNAINYNREGGEVVVEARLEPHLILVRVSDNGPGIAPEHLPHIFERFYRVDQARTTSIGRTGLGLAISQSIIQAHGGRVSVQSQFGKGTTFIIELPRDGSAAVV